MSHPDEQPEPHGAGHHSQTPQVAVRDGNRLICPCCGEVLMVIPDRPIEEMTVYQMGLPASQPTKGDPRPYYPCIQQMIAKQEGEDREDHNPPPPEPFVYTPDPNRPTYRADSIVEPIDPEVAAHQFPEEKPPWVVPQAKKPRNPPAYRHRQERDANTWARDRRQRRLRRPPEEAWTYELARFYAWTYYRLQKLDVQLQSEICAKQVEIDELERQVMDLNPEVLPFKSHPKTSSLYSTRPPSEANTTASHLGAYELPTGAPHAQADLGVAPGKVSTMSAGESLEVVSSELVSASTGESISTPTIEHANQANRANERGPP